MIKQKKEIITFDIQWFTISVPNISHVLEASGYSKSKNHEDPVNFWDINLSLDLF